MSKTPARADVVPACLSFLAIYNPTLSDSDETVNQQIVYYYTKVQHLRGERKVPGNTEANDSHNELNEKLRQVGLAQGMVQFAQEFSRGEAVDAIETEKSRIVLHNLEDSWWLLASIDLARITSPPELQVKNDAENDDVAFEYSAREVAQPTLLMQQLLRAHQIFLLHQGPSLADLWAKLPRQRFCAFLKRFWDDFIWNWDVILHGSPAVDVFNGLKLSAGGELGIGMEEQAWGSGEREILEGFIDRTNGLVDLIVSRFGVALHGASNANSKDKPSGGYGAGEYPGPSDGVIFSGKGALTRPSIRNVSSWMEWLYMHGEKAYGVKDNPSSTRRLREKLERPSNTVSKPKTGESPPAGIPAPIVRPADTQKRKSTDLSSPNGGASSERGHPAKTEMADDNVVTGTETLVKYLTLGVYGSQWGIPSGRPPVNERLSNLREANEKPNWSRHGRSFSEVGLEPANGYFLLGLLGELEEKVRDDVVVQDTDLDSEHEEGQPHSRIVMRTLHLERHGTMQTEARDEVSSQMEGCYFDKLRVVVYIHQPFMFAFLFDMKTDSLSMPSFYRSLHHQLGPLQGPLLTSTSPSKVSERLWEAAAPRSTDTSKSMQPISDLVYDPVRLTVHTTIPNIPEPLPGTGAPSAPWTRAEAVMVHSHIINTYMSTRRHCSELERTCKTSRGWWVVWMRLPHAPTSSHADSSNFKYREAFLIRKASDYTVPTPRKSSSRYSSGGSTESAGWGPGKLAEGIGIDARQYVEGLLSLNR